MNEQEYVEAFGLHNIMFSMIWPQEDPDLLVCRVENDTQSPNIVFHATYFDESDPENWVAFGETVVRMVSREYVTSMLSGMVPVEDKDSAA